MSSDIFKKTLITGADGMVGSYVDFGIRTDKDTLDVTNLGAVLALCRREKPRAIIHLAAATDVKRCEADLPYAYTTNAVGTQNVAMAAREVGAKFVYVSTNAVFSGTKEDPYTQKDVPNPKGHYGISKYVGELAVRSIADDYIIARASWMFGGGPVKDQKFVGQILRKLQDSSTTEIQAVSDAIGSPTYGKDLIAAIKRLLGEGAKGVFHLPNQGHCSRYEMTREMLRLVNPHVSVVPVGAERFGGVPSYEAMSSHGDYMRPWQEALLEYIKSEWL